MCHTFKLLKSLMHYVATSPNDTILLERLLILEKIAQQFLNEVRDRVSFLSQEKDNVS